MNVGVIGAGTIGAGLVRRLVTAEFVSEVMWVNRKLEKMEAEIPRRTITYSTLCRVGSAVLG